MPPGGCSRPAALRLVAVAPIGRRLFGFLAPPPPFKADRWAFAAAEGSRSPYLPAGINLMSESE